MTIHIDFKDKHCPHCNALYIPFYKDFKCPKCGKSINDYFDFVDQMIQSLNAHKNLYDQFNPPTWYTGSLVEYFQSIIFKIFDALVQEKPKNGKKYIKKLLDSSMGDEKEYLGKHLENVALRVYDVFEKEGGFSKKRSEKDKENINLFERFIP